MTSGHLCFSRWNAGTGVKGEARLLGRTNLGQCGGCDNVPLGHLAAGSIIDQQSHQLLSETQYHLCAMLAPRSSQPVVEPGRDTQAGLDLGDSGLFSQVTRVQGLPASLSKRHRLRHFHPTFLPSLLHSGSDQHHRLQVRQSLLPLSLFSLTGNYSSRFLTCSIPSWFLLSVFSEDLD